MQILCEDCNVEKSNLHETDYREEAAEREIDRKMALEALRLGL